MLDQSYYQKADEIIAFYGKKPSSDSCDAGYPGGISLSAGRIADVHCKRDWSKRGKGLQCCDFLREFSLLNRRENM